MVQLFGEDVDVTDWQNSHPGGRKLLKMFHRRDATQQFLAIHKGDYFSFARKASRLIVCDSGQASERGLCLGVCGALRARSPPTTPRQRRSLMRWSKRSDRNSARSACPMR